MLARLISHFSPNHERGRLLLSLVAVMAGLALLFVSLTLARTDTVGVREYDRADFMLGPAGLIPSATDGRWQPLLLPDLWWHRKLIADSGWYRLQVPVDHIPDQLQGIYLFRIHMNAAVYLNGQLLGDGGSMAEPLARNWNRPLYFNVPKSLWRVGNNELLINLRTYPGFGMMAAPQIAADSVLKPRYLWRQLLQNELSFAFTLMLSTVGLYILSFWLGRRKEYAYLWFAVSCFCWAFFNSSLFVRYAFFSPELYQKFTHVALDFWMLFLVGFMHRYLGLVKVGLERALFGAQTLFGLAFIALPMTRGYNITHVSHALTLLLAVYLALMSWRNWQKRPTVESLTMALVFVLLVFAGLHDWLMENPLPGWLPWEMLVSMWRNQFHFLFFMVPVLILFITWHLTQRFVAALNEKEQLNRELEARVAAAQQQLAASFEARQQLERAQAAALERERIYRDLHDDVGAKLLGLVISAQRASLPREADLARSALQDLRDVVSRSAHSSTPLGDLLADLRAETEQRVKAAGLELEWKFPENETVLPVSADAALNMSRIVREAVTNILRHAEADRVEIATQLTPQKFILAVSDNGRGCPSSDVRPHRGMTGMQARAAALNGTLNWEFIEPQGCRVTLDMPISGLMTERPR
ncbi:MAG: histidine kinase [Gallionella sp.]|nr:histidine kinase [Gallionella sp.]MDD4945306.1 histidine kinase [Gallionella sp.]